MQFEKFLYEENSDKPSVGRLLIVVIVMVYLILIMYVGIEKKEVPDFPVGAVGLISLLYGINKFSKVI